MNILIVSQYYSPEQFQVNEIAPALARCGHRVTVVCGLPNYPQGEVFEGYRHGERRRETVDGVQVVRCWQVARGHSLARLCLNYLSFCLSALWRVARLRGRYDVVYSYSLSPVTSALPAILYGKWHRVPHLLYCLDLWPESVLSDLKNQRSMPYRLVAWLSRRVYQACDRILVTSRPFIGYLRRENGVAPTRMGYLPQHAASTMLNMDLTATVNGVADFMFAGNMGEAQTLEVIVEAAAALGPRADYLVHMVGDGSRRRDIERMVAARGLAAQFVFHGNQRRDAMPAFYQKADALLLTLRGNNAVGDTVPGKLQMYMTTGKPILGAINGGAAEVIAEARCGSCVPAGDSAGLARLMRHYIERPQDYAACGARARAYFRQHFTLEKHIEGLEQALSALTHT